MTPCAGELVAEVVERAKSSLWKPEKVYGSRMMFLKYAKPIAEEQVTSSGYQVEDAVYRRRREG